MVILAPEPQLFLFLYKTQLFLFLYKNPSKSTGNLKNPSKSTEILQNFTKCPGETGQTPPTTTKYHLNTTRRLYNHPRTTKTHQNGHSGTQLFISLPKHPTLHILTKTPNSSYPYQNRPPNHRKSQKSFKIH